MTTNLYPETKKDSDVVKNLQEIERIREEDIANFQNLNQRFVLGRGLLTGRAAPANATDVLATDQEGDIVNDATYEYKLLNISGTLKWDRRALSTGW